MLKQHSVSGFLLPGALNRDYRCLAGTWQLLWLFSSQWKCPITGKLGQRHWTSEQGKTLEAKVFSSWPHHCMSFWSRDLSSKERDASTRKHNDSTGVVPNTIAWPPWVPQMCLNQQSKKGLNLLTGVRKSMMEQSQAQDVSEHHHGLWLRSWKAATAQLGQNYSGPRPC